MNMSSLYLKIYVKKNYSINDCKRGITSKHHVHFYCMNCLHSFRTENKLKCHEKVCKSVELQYHQERIIY